jgi:hypothetical protein
MNRNLLIIVAVVALVWYMNRSNIVDASGRDPG